jgi:polyisoprenyl-phosphate glycosyltransferase
MERVTIILPAYNEEAAIASVITQIKALPLELDIIVVDDGSADRTGEIAREQGVHVIRHAMNRGCGRSVKDGVMEAKTDIVVMIDADCTYPVESIPELLQKFSEGFDMVVGARQGPEYRGSFLKMPARFVFKFLAEFTTGRHIPDINSGLRIFRCSTVKKYFPDICDGFSFPTTITLIYMLTGKTVGYVPIDYRKRIGKSKVRIIRDSLRTLQYITEVVATYNPLKLFLLISIVLCVLALASFIHAMLMLNGATLVASAVLLSGAGVIFAIGLIAVPIGKIRRQMGEDSAPR